MDVTTGQWWLGGLRRIAARISPWTGLALLLYMLGGVFWLQWRFAVDAVTRSPDEVGGLEVFAMAAVGCAVVALFSGRVRTPVLLLALGLAVWVGAHAVSGWMLTSQVYADSLLVAAILAGLVVAVAAIPAALAGWTIAAVGAAYVYGNLWLVWQNYYSTGRSFPGVARWALLDPTWIVTNRPSTRPLDRYPAPDSLPERLQAFLQLRGLKATPEDPFGYIAAGLDGNPNGTGTVAALCVVFLTAFTLRRWGRWRRTNPMLVLLGRALLVLVTVPAGLVLIYTLDARAALAATLLAVLALILPLRWARSRFWSWAFAVAVPLLTLAPSLLASQGLASWNGRDCTWQAWWQVVQPNPVWGYGPPGIFPITACTVNPNMTQWWHAHNELFQAWGVGGLLGLATALAVLVALSWWAFRGRDRDERALLGLMTCGAVLLGFEVLVTITASWIRPSLVMFAAIAARSVQMIAARQPPVPAAGEPDTRAVAVAAGG